MHCRLVAITAPKSQQTAAAAAAAATTTTTTTTSVVFTQLQVCQSAFIKYGTQTHFLLLNQQHRAIEELEFK